MEPPKNSPGRMKGLLRSAIVFFLLTCSVGLIAQRVTNVIVEQQGQDLVISYALEAGGPVAVDLFVSTDHGQSWQGPLHNCSGDVGREVIAGTAKRIRWAVLQERELTGNGIRFKVVAKGIGDKSWLNPDLIYGSVADIDANTYATIQIGKQVWMAENLRTTRYRDGSAIPNIGDGSNWADTNYGACSYPGNRKENSDQYGLLYNWYVVVDKRGACPFGWHVPSDIEWQQLEKNMGVPSTLLLAKGWRGAIEKAGDKLKSSYFRQESSINNSGFSAISGGGRGGLDGLYFNLDEFSGWWSNTSDGESKAWYRYLLLEMNSGINRDSDSKQSGFFVRCVKD